MAQIFISYSHADKMFLDHLVPLIHETYAYDILWFDESIPGGEDWWRRILTEIAQCDLLVYLVSNESLESTYCQDELREAIRLDKRILPLISRRLNPQYPGRIAPDLADVLKHKQFIDLSGGAISAQMTAKLCKAINTLILFQNAPLQPNQLDYTEVILPEPQHNSHLRLAFSLRNNTVVLTANFANVSGCDWQGVGGAVLDLIGQALPGVRVHVFGPNVDLYTISGTNPLYGRECGWEIQIANAINNTTYFVELQSETGSIISSVCPITFPGLCEANLAVVNFEQIEL